MSRDPAYSIVYLICNDSGNNITIEFMSPFDTAWSQNNIATGTELNFYNDFGIGMSTQRYMENYNGLPFDSLRIQNNEGKEPNKDILDSDFWLFFFPDKEYFTGSIKLELISSDFQ